MPLICAICLVNVSPGHHIEEPPLFLIIARSHMLLFFKVSTSFSPQRLCWSPPLTCGSGHSTISTKWPIIHSTIADANGELVSYRSHASWLFLLEIP
ncbi:expressed protein [Echinococcus multilocularis]|uniref:Expressed protein n=1 Tax=Echinococcus multilocularis TaxID=6211 RepID=A0A087VXZ9_ECHMU|nr:expressed protein [Echinococcus multilocularis]